MYLDVLVLAEVVFIPFKRKSYIYLAPSPVHGFVSSVTFYRGATFHVWCRI